MTKHTGMHNYHDCYIRVMDVVKPRVVMEWGPGLNTELALERGAMVLSIEDNPKWFPEIDNNRWTPLHIKHDSQKYITPMPADLYFVDAKHRVEVLENIRQKYGSSVVFIHDAQRADYQQEINQWRYVRYLRSDCAVMSMTDTRIMSIQTDDELKQSKKGKNDNYTKALVEILNVQMQLEPHTLPDVDKLVGILNNALNNINCYRIKRIAPNRFAIDQ